MPEEKILVVDDEKNILLTVKHALAEQGYLVQTAATGEEALKQLAECNFDLLLLDLRLPGIDGLEVLRQAALKRPDIRVVIISAYGTVANVVEAMKLGAVDFLEKPFTPEELRSLVGQVLARRELPEKAANYQSCIELSKRCAGERHFRAAAEHARRAAGFDPARPEAFNLLGVYAEVRGEKLEAQKHYRAALELDPSFEPARHNLKRLTMEGKGRVELG
jgi:DNA-binding NtrC family response regulator